MADKDINIIDFEDDPDFADIQGKYFDPQDYHHDIEDCYTYANIRSETSSKSKRNSSSGSSLQGSSFWTLKRIIIALAILFGLGTLSKLFIILIALFSAI